MTDDEPAATLPTTPPAASPATSVVKINAIDVPDGAGAELEARFAARMGAVEGTAGFEGFELLRPVAGEARYFVYTRWADEESYQAWASGGARAAHGGPQGRRPVATGASLLEFEVVAMAVPTGGPVDAPR